MEIAIAVLIGIVITSMAAWGIIKHSYWYIFMAVIIVLCYAGYMYLRPSYPSISTPLLKAPIIIRIEPQ